MAKEHPFTSSATHDWLDVTCPQILINAIRALTVSYSRIVIVKYALPSTCVPVKPFLADLSMMTFGGMESMERQWHELLEGVALMVVSIELPNAHIPGSNGTSVAVLRQ